MEKRMEKACSTVFDFLYNASRTKVTISRPLAILKYELTSSEYNVFARSRATGHKLPDAKSLERDNRPVVDVSWEDAMAYAKWLSNQTGKQHRLPTEAEWEYATRAESTTAYSFGDDLSQLGKYAWYESNAGNIPHPVGQLKPNAWGLYDMHGNVWEWVQDRYGEDYYQQSPNTDPPGPSTGSSRVLRGGSFLLDQRFVRCAARGRLGPQSWYDYLGFRVVLLP